MSQEGKTYILILVTAAILCRVQALLLYREQAPGDEAFVGISLAFGFAAAILFIVEVSSRIYGRVKKQ